MKIQRLNIKNFRSIDELDLRLNNLNILCGPNSCGKTNVLEAIRFAFERDISVDTIRRNLPYAKRRAQGGPMLSVWVEITFRNVPAAVSRLGGAPGAATITYQFRARRNGVVSRKFGRRQLDNVNELRKHFDVVYVPPIRDLQAGGLATFSRLFADALRRTRGTRAFREQIRTELNERADRVLSGQTEYVRTMLGARRLVADTSTVTPESLYEKPELLAEFGHGKEPVAALGTGHQSLVILSLYRQLGDIAPGHTLFLFEEPGNHLHPSMVRAIGDELVGMADDTQVIATTHSPILLNKLDFDSVFPLYVDDNRKTNIRSVRLNSYTQRELRALLGQFGVRTSEPLLARRTIVVEGPADVTILTALAENRLKRSLEQSEVLIVPAGGKAGVSRLAGLLNKLDCDWRAVFDWDAAYSGQPGLLKEDVDDDLFNAHTGIVALRRVVDATVRGGKNFLKDLARAETEIVGGPPSLTLLSGSQLETLLLATENLSATARKELTTALRQAAKRRIRNVLGPRNVWLWMGNVEEVILGKDESIDRLDTILNANTQGSISERREILVRRLHNLSGEPEVLGQIVRDLDDANLFARTDMTAMYRYLFDGIG